MLQPLRLATLVVSLAFALTASAASPHQQYAARGVHRATDTLLARSDPAARGARPAATGSSASCRDRRPLRVHFYDVGQAAAALVELPDGRVILVDSGGYKTALTPKLKPDLKGRPLSLVWITHPHDDHLSQFLAVLRHARVEKYVDNGFDGGSPSRRSRSGMGVRMREAAANAGAETWSATSASFSVPLPSSDTVSFTAIKPKTWLPACSYGSEMNNCSLGIRIDYCASSILFLGDAEAEEEAMLPLSPATLLVVPHHGSDSSTSPLLLQRTQPRYAVISAGPRSKYCHPDDVVVRRLNRALGAVNSLTAMTSGQGSGSCGWSEAPRSDRLWVTAKDGDVTLMTRGDGMFIRED